MAGAARSRATGIVKLGLSLAVAALTAASVVEIDRGATVPPNADAPSLYRRLSLALESSLQTRETIDEARITLGPGGRDIRLAGELSEGVAARLKRLLDENPRVERIHLTSEGGLVDEGAAIGAQIAARGLVTYVPDYCVSACTLAFVRGRERLIVAEARLGFHAPYETGLFGQDVAADAAPERAAYIAAGVAPDFVDAALKVSSDDLWLPDARHLLRAGVATGIVDLRRFPDSTLDGGPDLAHARAVLLENFPQLERLERMAPQAVDAIAARYLDAYRSGLSEAEAVEEIERRTVRAAPPSKGPASPLREASATP